jgi:hypothetical protein
MKHKNSAITKLIYLVLKIKKPKLMHFNISQRAYLSPLREKKYIPYDKLGRQQKFEKALPSFWTFGTELCAKSYDG